MDPVSFPRWIPREERLPGPEDADAEGCVLGFYSGNGAQVVGTEKMRGYTDESGWRTVQRNTLITHWMPLPPPPGK